MLNYKSNWYNEVCLRKWNYSFTVACSFQCLFFQNYSFRNKLDCILTIFWNDDIPHYKNTDRWTISNNLLHKFNCIFNYTVHSMTARIISTVQSHSNMLLESQKGCMVYQKSSNMLNAPWSSTRMLLVYPITRCMLLFTLTALALVKNKRQSRVHHFKLH